MSNKIKVNIITHYLARISSVPVNYTGSARPPRSDLADAYRMTVYVSHIHTYKYTYIHTHT